MSFPLADWVHAHAGVPHNLALSGMAGSLTGFRRALRDSPPGDPTELRRSLARIHGTPPSRVHLTHGATEANALVLLFLARRLSRELGRTPRAWTPAPEYPPLPDAALEVGFRRTRSPQHSDVIVLSAPRNPTGSRVAGPELASFAGDRRTLLADQTFREFSRDPPVTGTGYGELWRTGSFTKVYGADELRVGYVIAPERSNPRFAVLHGLLLDQLPPRSVSGALALLAHRRELLEESRRIFRANERVLSGAIEGVGPLAAPLWFDRGTKGLDGDRFARALVREGVLACPGSFFGDPRGVRICLTRRSFAADLAPYLRVRERFL